jgi:dienelactone hydrolase
MISAAKPPLSPTCSTGPHERSEPAHHLRASLVNIVATEPPNSCTALARSGAEIRAAVGFHTTLATKARAVDPGAIKARMLVRIGADDPFITANQRAEFETEMRGVGADWQMNVYGRTVHSFTNQEAAKRNMPEAIRYSPESDTRAWASALDVFAQTLR